VPHLRGAGDLFEQTQLPFGVEIDVDIFESAPLANPMTAEPLPSADKEGASICGEIRWLQQSSAWVSTYDTALIAKEKQLIDMQEHRRVQVENHESRQVQKQFSIAKCWLFEKLIRRSEMLVEATVFLIWMELAQRPRHIRQLMIDKEKLHVVLVSFFTWRRSAGKQQFDTVLENLQAEMEDAHETAEKELALAQANYINVQSRTGQASLVLLQRSMGTNPAVLRNKLFTVWKEDCKSGAARRAWMAHKLEQNKSLIHLNNDCLMNAVIRAWLDRLRSVQKTAKLEKTVTRALLVISATKIKDMNRLIYDSWHQLIVADKRRKQMETTAEEVQGGLATKLAIVKAHQKAIRLRYAEQSMKIIHQFTKSGLLETTFRAWTHKAQLEWAEQNLIQMKSDYEKAEAKRLVHAKATVACFQRDLDEVAQSSLELVFVEWYRDIFGIYPQHLKEVREGKALRHSELEVVQTRARQQELLGAASVIAGHLGIQVMAVRHQAFAQMKIGALVMGTANLLADGVSKLAEIAETKQTLKGIRLQALHRRFSVAHIGRSIIKSWQYDFGRTLLEIWSALAARQGLERRWEDRLSNIETERARLQKAGRENRINRQRKVENLVLDTVTATLCRKYLLAWHLVHFMRLKAEEREEQSLRYKMEENELDARVMQKKAEVQMPMLTWLAQSLGSGGVSANRQKIILREWLQAAIFIRHEARHQAERKVARQFATEQALEVGVRMDGTLMEKVIKNWHMAAQLCFCEEERRKSARSHFVWNISGRRLRNIVRASTGLAEKYQDRDSVLQVYSAWRRCASVLNVERRLAEVCADLDGRIASARAVLDAEQAIMEKAFIICGLHHVEGRCFIAEFTARAVFPAWWLYSCSCAKRRAMLGTEEGQVRKLEELQLKAKTHCERWSGWVAEARFRMLRRTCAVEVFRGWRAQGRNQVDGRRKLAGVEKYRLLCDKMFERGNRMKRKGFNGWRRFCRQESVEVLERKLAELEELFVKNTGDGDRDAAWDELQELEGESSSEDSDEEESDWSETESRTESRASVKSRGSRGDTSEPSRERRGSRAKEASFAASAVAAAAAAMSAQESLPAFAMPGLAGDPTASAIASAEALLMPPAQQRTRPTELASQNSSSSAPAAALDVYPDARAQLSAMFPGVQQALNSGRQSGQVGGPGAPMLTSPTASTGTAASPVNSMAGVRSSTQGGGPGLQSPVSSLGGMLQPPQQQWPGAVPGRSGATSMFGGPAASSSPQRPLSPQPGFGPPAASVTTAGRNVSSAFLGSDAEHAF